MHLSIPSILTFVMLVNECELIRSSCPNVRTSLAAVRKRRHLAFPDGSNIVLTASTVKAFMTHIPAGWNLALEIDVLFPLPNANFTVAHSYRKKIHHQQKRELWQRFEDAFALHNLNGRACVLRSVCDARLYLAPRGKSLVHDILRAIFAVPEMNEEFRKEVQGSYDEVLTPELCEDIAYCPISLIHFMLSLKS